ncbi:MAG: preprotein translocase subunit YajC [Clostridia bacterium]|nr:preprotein translocase subunit YajC [Clostridia bacterium]
MFANALAIGTQTIMYIVIGVVLVLMIALSIIPQRKRKKQQEEMMNSLAVGTKIMTIGRMVGKIAQVNADNTLVVNVGTEDSPTLIVIDRNAVGLVLEKVAVPAAPATEEPTAPAEEVVEETIVEETVEETTEE